MEDRKKPSGISRSSYRKKEDSRETDLLLTKTLNKLVQQQKKIRERDADFDVAVELSAAYVFVHWSLFLTLQGIVMCKECKKNFEFATNDVKGVRFQLNVLCGCSDPVKIPLSPWVGRNEYEINRRFIYA